MFNQVRLRLVLWSGAGYPRFGATTIHPDIFKRVSGARMTSFRRILPICAILVLSLFSFQRCLAEGPSPEDVPTPEEYAQQAGNDAVVMAPGAFKLDGRQQWCGKRPVVIDDQLDDYGAAYPGFLIFNSKLMNKVSTPVKRWIFAHECGHQFRGPDEATADCFAVQRGRREQWLDQSGLEEVCGFISPARGDSMHFSGSYRCEYMRQCFSDPNVK